MGLNFYGNDFTLPEGGGPIIGSNYLDLFSAENPTLKWDNQAREHYFEYT